MNSHKGRLRGGGIRTLPEDRIAGMLLRIKLEGSGKNRRVQGIRYRITGFRHPDTSLWVSRNPRNGQYYTISGGRHHGVKPNEDLISRTDLVSLEVEIDRGRGNSRIYYVSQSR